MNTNIKELSALNAACDELLAGKYILADIKINSILNAIDNDTKIKDIVSNCVNDFSFSDLFNAVTSCGTLSQLNDPKQNIAFVYNLLYRFKNKDINFSDFLNTYYPDTPIEEQMVSLMNLFIIPFKQAIGDIFVKRHVIVESNEYQNNHYNKIKTTVNLILSNIDTYKLGINDKDEFTMLLNSLYNASDKNDKSLVYTLMVALDYFTKYHKKVRKTYLALEECFT